MKYIFHIGMGKTGTSSIQFALAHNQQELAQQNAHYLGMWFGLAHPQFDGPRNGRAFFDGTQEELQTRANEFHAACCELGKESGADTMILSNESLFELIDKTAPFFNALSGMADVRFVLYFRDPQQWLPSAFTQWSVFHKGPPGPIRSFDQQVHGLVHAYDPARKWKAQFGDQLNVREHAKEVDVVQDFAATIGFTLTPPEGRVQVRSEDAELLLRGLFNNRFPTPVLPERFNNMVFSVNRGHPPKLEDMIETCFSMEGADAAIAENMETFEFIRDAFGLDFTKSASQTQKPVDHEQLRNRTLDYLIEITMRQSLQLRKLEKELQELRDGKET